VYFTPEELDEVVETNNKKRFAFNEDKTMIRASQGHSIDIDLALETVMPPDFLYHGTAEANISSILEKGIEKEPVSMYT
jgi:putative RNA 2'-phosphotransferase